MNIWPLIITLGIIIALIYLFNYLYQYAKKKDAEDAAMMANPLTNGSLTDTNLLMASANKPAKLKPVIIHKADLVFIRKQPKNKYLCNHAVKINPLKMTDNWNGVTCLNCRKQAPNSKEDSAK